VTEFKNDPQGDAADELSEFLGIYKRSLPIEFDKGVKRIIDSSKARWHSAMRQLGLRNEFAFNATQGNLSRTLIEEDVLSLAESLGLKAGTFRTGGGSYHMKISTDDLILTVHTLGDHDGKMSRYSQYKKELCKSNPIFKGNLSKINAEPFYIAPLFRDINIGLPSPFPLGVFFDRRLYATLCLPRFQNLRNEIKLILPNSEYSGSIYEYDFLDIRISTSPDVSVNLYLENEIDPTQIMLKKDDINEIIGADIHEKDEDADINESS
jgi:hypothetical protein